MGMTASKLDRRVSFQRFTLVYDGFGQVESWEDHGAPVWALRQDVSDAEQWRASEVQATVTTRFHVRSTEFTRDIDPKDRLICEGETFAINGVKEAQQYGRRQLIELTCTRRTDD